MRPSCTQNPLRSCLNFRLRFGSSFGASCVRFWSYFGRVSGSNLAPRKVSKLKRPMCTKLYYLQYETMVFNLPRGSKIEEKSMPKRLQDKIGFQEAKYHEKVSNIGPSWSPRSSQLASKIEAKNQVYLKWPKTRGPRSPRKIKTKGLGPTGGKPPGHLAKAKWAPKLRMRYED